MMESASNGTGGAWRVGVSASAFSRPGAGACDAGALSSRGCGDSARWAGAAVFCSGPSGSCFGVADFPVPSPASASIVAIRSPSETSAPTLTFTSLIVPAKGAGTSMVALADSSVTRPWSLSTWSPGLTITSITGTPWKSPMSGTFASRTSAMSGSSASRNLQDAQFRAFAPSRHVVAESHGDQWRMAKWRWDLQTRRIGHLSSPRSRRDAYDPQPLQDLLQRCARAQ